MNVSDKMLLNTLEVPLIPFIYNCNYLFMFSGCMSCTPGLSDLDASMDRTCFVGVSEKISRGCIHLHKIIFVETPSTNRDHGRVTSLEAEDGSRFIGVSKITTRGSHPFHSVISAEVASTKVCFATETTFLATASSNVCPKLVKSTRVDKMVRSSKTFRFNQSLWSCLPLHNQLIIYSSRQ